MLLHFPSLKLILRLEIYATLTIGTAQNLRFVSLDCKIHIQRKATNPQRDSGVGIYATLINGIA